MIHKIIKGSYFKGALRYVLDSSKGHLIGGTFGSHQSPSQIAREMQEVAGDRLRKPVFHAVLSLRPGESLSDDDWNAAARRYLTALGYEDAPFVLVRHVNREHDHVHIIASRVRYDGTVVSDSRDRFKGLAAVRELTREYNLSMGATSERSKVAAELRALVRNAAAGQPSFSAFLARLEAAGIRVTTHVSPGRNRVQGLSFHAAGVTFKASQLGRELSWSGLMKLGVRFDHASDLPLVLARSSRPAPQREESAWTTETLRDLSRRLHSLREHQAGRSAARELLRQGAQAFRASAHVARFFEGSFRPAEAARRTASTLTASDHLSLALSFLGAFRSPGRAALFLLQAANRASAPLARQSADPAILFLRHLAQAATGDRPTFDLFRERLAEAGVHLGPGVFILPHRVIPGQEVGLGPTQLEKLGVHNARERFGRSDRTLRGRDRNRRGDNADSPISNGSPHPHRGSDRDPRATPDTESDPDRGARTASARLDGRVDLGRLPSPQQPPATRGEDLGHGLRSGPRDKPASRRQSHSSPTTVVPDRAAQGSAPDRTSPRRPVLPTSGRPADGALGNPSGASIPHELQLQLGALGGREIEIRARFPDRTVAHKVSSSGDVHHLLPHLTDSARRGAVLEIRSLDPQLQHLRSVSAEAIETARARGAEPAAVLGRGDGTFDVWIRHSPSATPETLSFLRRVLRLEYGQTPFGPSRTFGPLAGLDPTIRLVDGAGREYLRAQALADFFAASRRSLDADLAKRFQAAGVPPLSQYRQLHPGLMNVDRQWARFAVRQGLAPRDVALELVRSGSRAQTGTRSQALYASRIMSSVLPAASARELPKKLLAAASQVLGVSVNVLSTARSVFDQVARRTLGRS